MKIFSLNKNTWLIYYCLIAISSLLLITSINARYDELLSKRQDEQFYVTKIVKSDIHGILTHYETMLDLINEDFTEDEHFNQFILERILQKSELLIGFVIFNLDGTLLAKSDNLPDSLYKTRSSDYFDNGFHGSLEKDRLMISSAILSPVTNKWIIPIRKTLLDNNGEVRGFIASAIILDNLKNKWSHAQAFGNSIMLTLDHNFYQFLHTGMPPERYNATFAHPLTEEQITETETALKAQNLSFNKLRANNAVAQVMMSPSDIPLLHSLSYDSKYKFWVHTSRPLSDINQPLLYTAIYYFALYLLFLSLTFLLFKWILNTEKSKLTALTYITEHDDLTGCFNRTVLGRLVGRLKRHQQPFSLLYIDLDNFKNINDSFGHKYGDILLQEVSRKIQESLRTIPGNLVRYSGDEFVLLLENNNEDVIRGFAKLLLRNMAKPYSINNNSFYITSSIGITRYPNDAKSLDTLISYAENSMAMAKSTKNQYIFFSQEVHQQLLKQAKIEQALHHAIENNEISLAYQPQLNSQSKLCGVEALVRWQSSDLGFIPPEVFIPIAEQTGLMPKLGQYILNKSMYEITALQKKLNTRFSLAINVSVKQFIQLNFFDVLTQSIEDFGDKSLPLTIEITESLFIESVDVLLPVFEKMKQHQISLALDDFGTGYSSLSMLREAPIDELKIDKSFVDHITENNVDKAMVKSIISMGKNLNMRVLAEGIETLEHAKILSKYGCDLFQGYYISKPLNIEELEVYVNTIRKRH
ncbi:EAL domain-containing protein [Psychromonas sp. 14N.309.X.WAT.B.A12]|uniref:bifunctional diguanylate cyclase/phosphodiesterase n=1 Tax=Psychromonas sp. 14N.309.X.WAT.B.A12 TaxID=2998322 RepID=UPI0025B1EE5D|nr:EAL domain-containing protein [Psychromonas sp. 14N.309.X.WAT.B.A12]MDN2664841.1 EAL domain-containing protein [Psychromonas sp. 14N.309.X.WAT.B.A12]